MHLIFTSHLGSSPHLSSPSSLSSSSCIRASSWDTRFSLLDFWEPSRWDNLLFRSLFYRRNRQRRYQIIFLFNKPPENWWKKRSVQMKMKTRCGWNESADALLSLRCIIVCLFPLWQERVYLSLQSNLVTLQVLSASPLLQEFIPHLLHLSSRVQTASPPQPHTAWQLLAHTSLARKQKPQRAVVHESKCWRTLEWMISKGSFASWIFLLGCIPFFCQNFYMTFVPKRQSKLIVSIE